MPPERPLPQLGPWKAESLAGRGGTALVYRARHAQTGEVAALKTVRLPDPRLMGTFRREIHALSRVSHPGVVRILDHGVHEGLPWYAMAFVEGRPLLEKRRAGDTFDLGDDDPGYEGERSAGPDLAVFLRLCETLAVLHAAGLVHRDLKPANVIVTSAGPVLVDFGLAGSSRAGRESLVASAGVSAGTAAYVAPEQILGEPADARSDLYALGCMLYEALTGQPPHVGPPRAVLEAHLSRAPAPPSSLAPMADELEQLVMGLLARQPRDRISQAHDVARALAPFSGVEAGPAPSPVLYRPDRVGRDEVIERVLPTEGGVAVLRGPEGVGKTRLLVEIARRLSRDGARVFVGSAAPDVPLGALQEPLAAFADLARAGRVPGDVLAATAGVLTPYAPSLGAAAAPELPRNEAVLRLHRALGEAFASLGGRVVILLDDLHDADDLAVGWLHREAVRRGARVAVVAAWRTEAETPALARLAQTVPTFELGPLSDADARRAAAGTLGLGAPDAAVDSAVALAGGNPRRFVDALRLAVDEGRLVREDGVWRDAAPGAPWPRSADEIVARRLARLAQAHRAALERAAVLGRADPDADPDAVDAAVRQGLLDDELAFESGVRRALLAGLSAERARDLHRAAAERTTGAIRAQHVAASGDAAAARPLLEQAAKEAIARGALDHAERWYRLWLSLPDASPADEARVLDALASEVLRLVGRARECPALHERAVALADASGDVSARVRSRLGLGRTLVDLGDLDVAAEVVVAARDQAEAAGLDAVASAWGILGSARRHQGRLEEARACFETSASRFESRGDPLAAALVRADLAGLFGLLGRRDEALALYAAAHDAVRRLGSPRQQAQTLTGMASWLVAWERPDEALEPLREALAIHRRIGARSAEAYALVAIGGVLDARGERVDALASLDAAIGLGREAGETRFLGSALLNRAIVARRAGRLDLADADLAEARRLLGGDRLALGRCAVEEGHVALDRGQSAAAALTEARAIAISLGVRAGPLQAAIDELAARSEQPSPEPDPGGATLPRTG